MNPQKSHHLKRFAPAAVAAMLCLSLSLGIAASDQMGRFRNLFSWSGAVIGSVYEGATQEIDITLSADRGILTVTAVLLQSQNAPYLYLETISVYRYQITDLSGNVIAEDISSSPSAITDGRVTLTLPLPDVEPGQYQLQIDSLLGEKKADQPLEIRGDWSCQFTL